MQQGRRGTALFLFRDAEVHLEPLGVAGERGAVAGKDDATAVEYDGAIERTELEVLDEVTPEEAARTPTIPPQTRPYQRPILAGPAPVATPREVWGATSNGPIVE